MTKLSLTAALVAAFFVSGAQSAEDTCDNPDEVRTLMLEMFPNATLWQEHVMSGSVGQQHHVQIYRSPSASTDFAVIFDEGAEGWCAVSSMELPKLGEPA